MSRCRYHVARLYDEAGQVAPHFINDEFHMFCDTWQHAMSNTHFAAVISQELRAESYAELPLDHLCSLAPNERVRTFFLIWLDFIDDELEPWTTGGAIHFRPHWARVLMHALIIGDKLGFADEDLRCLAMAAVFHDSRRQSPYLDKGHGARAASYYLDACWQRGQGAADYAGHLIFDPRAMLAMAWHDRDDEEGLSAVSRTLQHDEDSGFCGMRYSEALPDGAKADAATILRVFKDADGLDRVRLGDGGLDERYLRIAQARNQVEFAYELLAASEILADEG